MPLIEAATPDRKSGGAEGSAVRPSPSRKPRVTLSLRYGSPPLSPRSLVILIFDGVKPRDPRFHGPVLEMFWTGPSATLTSSMSVSQTRIRVRYAETDQMGVVYYANFFIWFELGRVELLRQLGFQYKQMEIDDDCHIPVVEANCRYKSPAHYDDDLLLETRVLALRRSVIKFGYRLLRAENNVSTLLAEGETTHVTVNRTMRKVPLPKKYVSVLEQFLV